MSSIHQKERVAGRETTKNRGRQGSSFLKKRSKKLLSIDEVAVFDRAPLVLV
jgi:hypothetical protein